MGFGNKVSAAVGGGKTAVGIQPRGALAAASREGPLLRPQLINQCMAEAAVVEVAAGGQALVFVKQLGRPTAPRPSGLSLPLDVHTEAAQDRLRVALGTRVRIVRRGQKGRIEIDFASQSELQRLFEHLTGSETGR